jgi:hypothetical protein
MGMPANCPSLPENLSMHAVKLRRKIRLADRQKEQVSKPIKIAVRETSSCFSGGAFAILLVVLLCGCASTQMPPPPPPPTAPPPPAAAGDLSMPDVVAMPIGRPPRDGFPAARDGGGSAAPPPRYHGYQLFAEIDTEPSGYGMYTYVLSGNVTGTGQPASGDVQRRYDALLQAIVARTSSVAALTAAAIPRKETNVFCIPAKAGTSFDTPSLQNYGSQLAIIYRLLVEKQLASETVRRNLENHMGPFLVSSLTRLNQARSGAPILFADLSNTHPDAIQEVVDVYKQRVSQAPIDKTEVFKPFKLALLNVILNGNDYVQIEKVAIAGVLPPAGSHP